MSKTNWPDAFWISVTWVCLGWMFLSICQCNSRVQVAKIEACKTAEACVY